MVQNISRLQSIPPTHWLDNYICLLQGNMSLLNLHLQTPMREGERYVVIEKDFCGHFLRG